MPPITQELEPPANLGRFNLHTDYPAVHADTLEGSMLLLDGWNVCVPVVRYP